MDDQDDEMLIPIKGRKDDLDIKRGWTLLGMNIKDAETSLSMEKRSRRRDSPV